MNKRGWLRIVEAFLAVLIILSAVLIIMSKQDVVEDSSDNIAEVQNKILEIISKNDILRGEILAEDKTGVIAEISLMLPKNLNFTIGICKVNDACGSEGIPYDKSVYTKEILITSTLSKYEPKKLRLFVWER